MAVSSSIGSNLFDVTVGLPVPWLLYTIIFGRAMEVLLLTLPSLPVTLALGQPLPVTPSPFHTTILPPQLHVISTTCFR